MYNQSNFQVDIYHRLDSVALRKSAILRSLGSDFPFFLSPGEGSTQTPSHISSFDTLGVRNNQHQ